MSKSKKSHKRKQKQDRQETSAQALPLALLEGVGDKDTLDKIIGHYNRWLPKYQELAQGRSNFQIEKMIATEQVTPAASYQHTLYQLRVLHQSLLDDFVRGIEKTREFEYKWKDKPHDEPQWWELEQGGKKLCWYDTDRIKHEHDMEELKMSVKDKLLQLDTFTKVLSAMEKRHGGAFTQEELNAEEPEYWKLRLARQMTDSYMDRETGLGTGNITSLRRALAASPLKDSQNRIDDFPDLFNAVLGGRDSAMKVLNEVNEKLFADMDNLGAHTDKLNGDKKREELSSNKQNSGNESDEAERLRSVGIGLSDLDD